MYILEPYQEKFISDIGQECKSHKTILAQSETGSGKTVCFATIASRFLEKSNKDVIIFCDSDNIFTQTRKTLFNWYGIDSDTINRESSIIKRNTLFGQARVFVAMVETFDRRSSRDTFLHQVKDVGLVIIDECHMGNFYKIFEHFPFSLRIGFTATPIASNKKHPLKNYYETIVCGPTTSQLIELNKLNQARGVVRDVTYCLTNNIDRKALIQEELDLGYKGEDFNQDLVGSKLKNKRQIQNSIDAYVKHCPGKKMLCFNANISHSEYVTTEMCKYGLNARHIDSNCGDEYKKATYDWFSKTANGILCNVGMATKGYDEPSVEVTMLNTLTKSITKFRQMCGRSARPYLYPDGHYKEFHFVLDMCDNVLGGGHGQWSDDRDWKFMFENPKSPKTGVAPSKSCPECDGICPASERVCKCMVEDFFNNNGDFIECGYVFPVKEIEEDTIERSLILISKNIDVKKIIDFPRFAGRSHFYTFYETIRSVAYFFRKETKYDVIDEEKFNEIWKMTYEKIYEWQKIKGEEMNSSGRKLQDTKWYHTKGIEHLKKCLEDEGFVLDLKILDNVQI